MGKRIITQKRGAGAQRYTAPSHRYKTAAHYTPGERDGKVDDIQHDVSKTGVVMRVAWSDGKRSMYLAPEGIMTGDTIAQGGGETALGSILTLGSIPEGMPIFNIEARPGDGGKVVRASGAGAYIVAKKGNLVMVRLPSRRVKPFSANCRASIGISAGGGRLEKPLVKAGNAWKKHRARGHRYPMVRGVAMNPISHPHGGSQHHAGKPTTVSRNAPPGQKVGHIASRRTGRRKR